MKQFQVKLPSGLMDEFDAVTGMTGMTKGSVVQQAVEQYVSVYENERGKFNPVPGKVLHETHKNEDGTFEYAESKCMILGNCTMNGQAYKTVYENGRVYKAPAEKVIML